MTDDVPIEPMADKLCACGAVMFAVITYDTPEHRAVRTGWFCAKCRAWSAAIGRERMVRITKF